MYPYFEIFGRTIGSYAVLSFIGLFAAVITAWCLSKRMGIGFEDIILITVSISLGMLIGGHFLYALTNCEKIINCIRIIAKQVHTGTLKLSHITASIQICFGGMVFYGGFVGALAALLIHIKISKIKCKKEILDVFAVCVPLFHGFGRIGCFLGGCCYGKESKIGFIAYNDLVPEMSGIRRFPVSLAESAFCFFIFFILLRIFNKNNNSGMLIYMYMLLYSVTRFILEFFRGDTIRGIFFCLSTSQWISIILFAVGIGKLIANTHYRKQSKNNLNNYV